ncbi:MAG: polyphosphate kinase 1 [Actinobacteria bacterium]|nr:polyphosphate kinase 1 [Actinomycetota bacterium]MBA3565585.1 polyphosphate kinase 1 [Actinomycetota bacterium]MDQ3426094.1 polyphosphate kinase 1 [Actinomycetota bacterium]
MHEADVTTRIDSPGKRLLNRELSLLDFHARVLELAADDAIPLLERVKFCAILSSNVDEFFQVRVAGLLGQAESGLTVHSPDGLTPQQALAEIRERVLDLTSRQSRLWKRELRPALAAEGIIIGGVKDCQKKDLKELERRFEREIYPVLTPLAVGPGQPFPYISGLSLSLAVFVADADTGEERLARVKIPEGLPRFLAVGRGGLYVSLERVIAHFLPRLFPGVSVVERAVFRVTRDADFEVSDDAADLLEAVETELRKRRFGDVVRLEVSSSASEQMVERLTRGLGADESQVYRIESPLDLADLMELALIERPDLMGESHVPVVPPRLAGAQTQPARFFDEIRRGDILVHQPYDSYRASFETFAQAAALDPDVIVMKTAVYRTSNDSVLVGSLIQGAEEGKQAVCLVELKARFDERRNIEWSRALEEAGVHVAYGFPDMKIHAKTTLVVRREGGVLRRYAHIGTGNYHAATARQYEDIGIFTADEDITADVAELFNHITGFGRTQDFRKLLVAPFTLRSGLVDEIRAVAAAAAEGEPARIRLKLNHLVDPGMVEELYAASQAGAEIDVIARSTCALRPGVEGLSENVRVRSIVGRFLEHSRVFAFEAGERSTTYVGSADLMTRNLDHRIEVLVPIESIRARQEVHAILDSALADNANAWLLGSDGSWTRATSGKSDKRHSHYAAMTRRAAERARRGTRRVD